MTKNYTKAEILALVAEMKAEEKKTQRVPHFYKRNGKMVERFCPDYIYTERYKELFYSDESPLRSAKIFKCEDCGEMVAYLDLEAWTCDFEKDSYVCSMCYEDSMGEDL